MSGGSEPLLPEDFRALLDRELPRFGLGTPQGRASERLARFLAELDRWRASVNLTGQLSPRDLVAHCLESVLGERFLPAGTRVVDIGTGGGFPGVPLAIWRPDLEVTWLEPRAKRVAFLRHVARAVPVANATILEGRMEDLADSVFDCATSRAVRVDGASLGNARFLRPGGSLVLWTTAPGRLAPELSPAGLRFEGAIAIPGTRRREIGLFRRV